jgi:diamine N-acetyltransferase
MSLSIDAVTVDDLEEVITMAQELSIHEGMPPAELTTEGLRAVLFGSHPLLSGRTARIGEVVAGYALWTVGYTMQYGKPLLDIADLYVRPAFRRQGIARALMQEMAGVAQEQGYRFLTVTTFDGNVEANAFYSAIGGELDSTNVYAFGQKAMAKLMTDNS